MKKSKFIIAISVAFMMIIIPSIIVFGMQSGTQKETELQLLLNLPKKDFFEQVLNTAVAHEDDLETSEEPYVRGQHNRQN